LQYCWLGSSGSLAPTPVTGNTNRGSLQCGQYMSLTCFSVLPFK
jgi:hypothetical protein